MNELTEIKNWYLANFEAFENSLNGQKGEPFHQLRKAAIESFTAQNFPTTKDEEWRNTNIAPILKHNFVLPTSSPELKKEDLNSFLIEGFEADQLVFVNGRFSKELSSEYAVPKGAIIGALSEELKTNPALVEKYFSKLAKPEAAIFTALGAAFTEDGIFIYVPDGKVIEKPLYILNITSAGKEKIIVNPRNIIIAGQNSQVKIIERYVSLDEAVYFTNPVTEIVCGKDSVVEHIKLQDESLNAFHISTTEAELDAGSNFSSYNISTGSAICRNTIKVKFIAEGAECTLNGLYLADGLQLLDNHTTIDHAVPNCESRELYKGALNGKSRAVFNGKVIVRKDAQKTNAFQQNKTILLSDEALIDTKPQLEIFADDVKCSHGATIGQLDEDSLFYLRSRGIGAKEARTILIYAFANDVVKTIKIDSIKKYLEKLLAARLMK